MLINENFTDLDCQDLLRKFNEKIHENEFLNSQVKFYKEQIENLKGKLEILKNENEILKLRFHENTDILPNFDNFIKPKFLAKPKILVLNCPENIKLAKFFLKTEICKFIKIGVFIEENCDFEQQTKINLKKFKDIEIIVKINTEQNESFFKQNSANSSENFYFNLQRIFSKYLHCEIKNINILSYTKSQINLKLNSLEFFPMLNPIYFIPFLKKFNSDLYKIREKADFLIASKEFNDNSFDFIKSKIFELDCNLDYKITTILNNDFYYFCPKGWTFIHYNNLIKSNEKPMWAKRKNCFIGYHGLKKFDVTYNILNGGFKTNGPNQNYADFTDILTHEKCGIGVYFSPHIEVAEYYCTKFELVNSLGKTKNFKCCIMCKLNYEKVKIPYKSSQVENYLNDPKWINDFWIINESLDIWPIGILIKEI